MASSRRNVLTTLFQKYFRGSLIDSLTSKLAAKCMTASIEYCSITCFTSSESAKSPTTSGPHFAAQRCPLLRLSRTIGSYPSRASALAQ